jgi:hypothetical protein
MEDVLSGVVTYLKAADTLNRFRVIDYSEMLDDMIHSNKTPFIDVVGTRVSETPLAGFKPAKARRGKYYITLIIVQDKKVLREVLKGSESIWGLKKYLTGLINADSTFGGIVQGLAFDENIDSEIVTLKKDNSVKLALEVKLVLFKDIFN